MKNLLQLIFSVVSATNFFYYEGRSADFVVVRKPVAYVRRL